MPAAPAPQATPSQCTEVAAASASKLDKAADKALAPLPAGPTADPIGQLQLLVSESARRSAEVGAAKLLAEAAGTPSSIRDEVALPLGPGSAFDGFSFQPLWDVITEEQPDLFD